MSAFLAFVNLELLGISDLLWMDCVGYFGGAFGMFILLLAQRLGRRYLALVWLWSWERGDSVQGISFLFKCLQIGAQRCTLSI